MDPQKNKKRGKRQSFSPHVWLPHRDYSGVSPTQGQPPQGGDELHLLVNIQHPHSIKWYFNPNTLECENIHITFTLKLHPNQQPTGKQYLPFLVSTSEDLASIDQVTNQLQDIQNIPPYGLWSVWFKSKDGTPSEDNTQVRLASKIRFVPRTWDGTPLWKSLFLYQLTAHCVLENILSQHPSMYQICVDVLNRNGETFGLFPWPQTNNICLYILDAFQHSPLNLPYTCMFNSNQKLYGIRLASLLEYLFTKFVTREQGLSQALPNIETIEQALSYLQHPQPTWSMWAHYQAKAMEYAYDVFIRVEDITKNRCVVVKPVHTDKNTTVPIYRVYMTRNTFTYDLPPPTTQLSPELSRVYNRLKHRSLLDQVNLNDIEIAYKEHTDSNENTDNEEMIWDEELEFDQ